jgi:hypothetical protein
MDPTNWSEPPNPDQLRTRLRKIDLDSLGEDF